MWGEKMGTGGKSDSGSPNLSIFKRNPLPSRINRWSKSPWSTWAQFSTNLGLCIQMVWSPLKL